MTEVDVLIEGAGPAGTCAALRLRQWGYRVGIVERAEFPRPQIGESLTPGVRNMLSLLDADDAMAGLPHVTGLPTWRRWQQADAEITPSDPAAVVSRAEFDARLLALARARGVQVWQPARTVSRQGEPGAWRVEVAAQIGSSATTTAVQAQWLMDATGRQGPGTTRWACAPRSMATWGEWRTEQVATRCAQAVHIEALPQGWLWASPLPHGGLRGVMFSDPQGANADLQTQWRSALQASLGLHALADVAPTTPWRACVATPYLDTDAWQPGRLKLGDAAFAVDPISGSGVEKAMRFSLQAAVACRTWMGARQTSEQALAQRYYEQQLLDTCARHVVWAAGHHARAWCADHAFWQARAKVPDASPAAFQAALDQAAARQEAPSPEVALERPLPPPTASVHLDEACGLMPQLCVIDDRVSVAQALTHPRLPRAVAFVADQALAAHWDALRRGQPLGDLRRTLGLSMHADAVQAVLRWLWRSGLLVSSP